MILKAISIMLTLVMITLTYGDGILKIMRGPGNYLSPMKTSLVVDINNQVGATQVRQSFINTQAESVEVKYCFPLGLNASVTAIAWETDSLRYTGVIQAGAQDSSTTGDSGVPDYNLNAYLGASPFFFSLPGKIGPGKELVVELSYIELLGYRSGTVSYLYPYQTPVAFTSGTIEFLEIAVNLVSQRKITGMASASWQNGAVSFTDYQGSYTLQSANPGSDRNFDLQYTLDASDLGLFMLSTRPDSGDGYFLMIAEPDPSTSQQQVIDKVFTYVIDRSGSMGGTKISQAREAAKYCILNLNSEDRFNIVIFDDVVETFRSVPVPANASNISAALQYVDRVTARGMTDINNALLTALAQYRSDTTSNIVIFLTDGYPTSGITGAQAILDNIRAANAAKVKIFPFGIGAGTDNVLLSQLALQNNGAADFLDNNDVNQEVSEFYAKIKDPVIQNISLSFSTGGVEQLDLLPLNIPDIFLGQQLIVAGRYKTSGATTVTLNGSNTTGPIAYSYDAVFSDSAVNVFVAKIWAKMRIEALMSLIYKVGEASAQGQEYKAEVIALSIQYGIQTDYTSYVDNGTPGPITEIEEQAVPEAVNGKLLTLTALPNPFNPSTRITFFCPQLAGGEVVLFIYSVDGRLVMRIRAALVNGRTEFAWDGRDMAGNRLGSGVYVVRIMVGKGRAEVRLMLAK